MITWQNFLKNFAVFCGQSKTAGAKTCFKKRASRVVQLLISYCTSSTEQN